jgi:molecular chaperone GrpE (heat shock protein)
MSEQNETQPAGTEPVNPPAPTAEPATPPAETDWKAESRKWEQRAKANSDAAKRLEEIEAAKRTTEERAQHAAAEAEKRAQAAYERVARAELKAALTGVVSDPGAVVDDLNVSKFLNDAGDVDSEAVNAFKARYEGLFPKASKAPAPNPAQGSNGGNQPEAGQLTHQDVKRMSPEQIADAQSKGLLDNLMLGL